jgi:hypothetical protein
MAFHSFSLERLLGKSRRAPVHPVFPSNNNRILVRPGSLLLIERRDDGRERQGAHWRAAGKVAFFLMSITKIREPIDHPGYQAQRESTDE